MFSYFTGKTKNKPTNTSTLTSSVQKSKPKIVSLIFSHNSRMQCFIERFKKENMKSEKIRFKNGAIIKLVVENGIITPSLVYEGELDEKETKKIVEKGAYYTKNDTTKTRNVTNLTNKLKKNIIEKLKKESTSVSTQNGNTFIIPRNNNKIATKILNKNLLNKKIKLNESFKIFDDFFGPKNLSILQYLTKEKTIDIDPNQTYEFYIIRHGQGIHNGVSKIQKIASAQWYKDATLTAIGKEQASRSGVALNQELGNNKVNYLFATDLRRTRETLVEVLGKLTNQLNLKNPNIIILPCSHEISVEKDKNGKSCDEVESSKLGRMAVENFPVCVMGRGISFKGTLGLDKGCKEQNGYPIDWSYYLAFYNNTMRGIYSRSWSRLRCRDTNMIIEALNIIKNGPKVIEQYKKNIEKKGNNYSLVNNNNNETSITSSTISSVSNTRTINQTNLNKIQAITKILENKIAKYKWTNPSNNLLKMHRQMRSIGNKIKVNNEGKINPNDMKMAKENYEKLLEIESKMNKNKLTTEMEKISSNRLTLQQKRIDEIRKKYQLKK